MAAFYMDHHVPRAITSGLRRVGVEVLTAAEDARAEASDPRLLDRATELGRVFFTRDEDLLVEGSRRQSSGEEFSGIVYAHQLRVSIGECVASLTLIAGAATDEELLNSVIYLPL